MSGKSKTGPSLDDDGDPMEMIWKTNNKEETEQDLQMHQTSCNQSLSRRKSDRVRSTPRPFSPDKIGVKKSRGGKKLAKSRRNLSSQRSKSYSWSEYSTGDKLPNGAPFSCDLCKSPYIISREKCYQKTTRCPPTPRYKVDRGSGKTLQLCNACGLAFDRPVKQKRDLQVPTKEEKDTYIQNAKAFAWRWNVKLNNTSGVSLYCPEYRKKPCGCLQTYITSADDPNESTPRAEHIIKLWKEAKDLSTLKYYPPDQLKQPRRKRNIGLGNGMRKSKEFEAFIIKERQYLRETLKLCERATQKILCYSNNFIHKKLKSEQGNCRAERQIGKAALGQLAPLGGLEKTSCCTDGCVRMAATHLTLLAEWRRRGQEGQGEARRVLAEMLTPSGGSRPNCYNFISMVTGRSLSLIGSVNDQMRRTGGNRQPPVHGMKKFWLKNRKSRGKASIQEMQTRDSTMNQESRESNVIPSTSNDGQLTSSKGNNESTAEQFAMQRQQLFQLQQQLAEQQAQIQHHQQIVQQQLQQQFVLHHFTENGTTSQIVKGGNHIFGSGDNGQQQFLISTNQQPAIADTNQRTSFLQIHPVIQNTNATFTPLQTIPSSQIATQQQLTSPVLFQTQNISLIQSPTQIQGTGLSFGGAPLSPAVNSQGVTQLTPEGLQTSAAAAHITSHTILHNEMSPQTFQTQVSNQAAAFQAQNLYQGHFPEHGAVQQVHQPQAPLKVMSQARPPFHSHSVSHAAFEAYNTHHRNIQTMGHLATKGQQSTAMETGHASLLMHSVPSSLLQKQTAAPVLNPATTTTPRVFVPAQTLEQQPNQEVDNLKTAFSAKTSSEHTMALAAPQLHGSVQATGAKVQFTPEVRQRTASEKETEDPLQHRVSRESSGQLTKEPNLPIHVVVRLPVQSDSLSKAISYQPVRSSTLGLSTNTQSLPQVTSQSSSTQVLNQTGSGSSELAKASFPVSDINPNLIIAESETSPVSICAQPLQSGNSASNLRSVVSSCQSLTAQTNDVEAKETEGDHNYSVRPLGLIYSGSVPMLTESLPSGNVITQSSGNHSAQASGNVLAHQVSGYVLAHQVSGNVLAQKSGNVLAQTSGNVLAQTSGNVLAEASGNVLPQSSGNVLAQTSGNVLAQSSGNILAQSSGNVLAQSSGNILAQSSGNVLAQVSGNVLAQGSGSNPAQSSNILASQSASILAQSSSNTLAQPSASILAQLSSSNQSTIVPLSLSTSAGLNVALFQIPTTQGIQTFLQPVPNTTSDQVYSKDKDHSKSLTETPQTNLLSPVTDRNSTTLVGQQETILPTNVVGTSNMQAALQYIIGVVNNNPAVHEMHQVPNSTDQSVSISPSAPETEVVSSLGRPQPDSSS